jgi:SAM-dependent methyltransferase
MTMLIANVEMAKAWDGEEGDQWTEAADRYEASGQRIWRRFLDAGLISSTDHVLDLGCGTGHSTRDAARAANAGFVLGVDLSSRMLQEARRRAEAEGVHNVEFLQADAQVHPFDEATFDIAISSFGGMFFGDPVAAYRNIGAALRPNATLGLLAWRPLGDNDWLNVVRDSLAAGRDLPAPPTGAPGPFGLADADGVRSILGDAGFGEIALTPIDEPMWFGRDAADAWSFWGASGVVRGLSHGLDDDARTGAHATLQRALADHETPEGVLIGSASWLITARRA